MTVSPSENADDSPRPGAPDVQGTAPQGSLNNTVVQEPGPLTLKVIVEHRPAGLLDRAGAASFMSMSTRTLDRLIADVESGIPVIRLYGCVLFDPNSLREWAVKVGQHGGLK